MARVKKILYVSNLYPPNVIGGAELLASYLAEYVANGVTGYQVTVVSTGSPADGQAINREILNGVEVLRFFPKNLYWVYDRRRPSQFKRALWHVRDAWNPDAGRRLQQIIRDVQPNLIHTHNIDGFSPIVWALGKKAGIPVLHSAHDYHLLCPRATLVRSDGDVCTNAPLPCQVYRRWYGLQTGAIDLFVAESQFLIDLHKSLGTKAKSFRLVRNGVPLPGLGPAGTVKTPGVLTLLYLGQLVSHKGVSLLLEAVRSLPQSTPVVLNIAGTGPLEQAVREVVEVDHRVHYHGFVTGEAKERLLASSDVLVLPSQWYENGPLSIIEAYTHGAAVIVSDIGGQPEMVDDGNSGLLFNSGSAPDLADKLRQLVEHPLLLQRLQEGARKVAPAFSVKRMGDEYLGLYDELWSEVG